MQETLAAACCKTHHERKDISCHDKSVVGTFTTWTVGSAHSAVVHQETLRWQWLPRTQKSVQLRFPALECGSKP